jgi:hypothetical protein
MDFQVDHPRGSGDTLEVTTHCARSLLEEFLTAHDIDPSRFPMPGRIRIEAGRVTFEQVVLDQHGKLIIDGDDIKRELITVTQRAPWPLDTQS